MFTRGIVAVAFALSLGACAGQHNSLTKAQECATELNTNTRFGRMQLASEYVAAKEKKGFFERHAGWGTRVRVLDAEMIGMDLINEGDKVKDKEPSETIVVSVKVAWTFADDQDLRVTTVTQKWKPAGEGWALTQEERVDGDPGLFGEKVVTLSPPVRTTQFATIHLQ